MIPGSSPAPPARASVLVVGGGIAGVATAYFLARRGVRDVVLLEREASLGAHSTGRNAGILRTWTGDEPTRLLAAESARFLRTPPEGFTEVPLVDPVGLVLFTDPERAEDPAAWRALARECGLEELAPARAAALVPWFVAPPGKPAWIVRAEGRLDGAALLEGFARGARAGGVRIVHGSPVVELTTRAGAASGARLADGTEIAAEQVVIAAGGWAEELGRALGSPVRLRPTRRHLLVTAPDPRIDPRWPVVWTDGLDPFYARPESGGLLMSGCDQVDVAPDACTEDLSVRELIARKAARYVPEFADAGIAHFWSGLRTLTADGRFVVGPDPAVPGLAWVAGLGGHGMTCGPAVGRLAADLLLDPAAAHPAARPLAPARFAGTSVVG